jgi:cation diffusion facilitator family transporter
MTETHPADPAPLPEEEVHRIKESTARLSVLSNSGLVVLKLVVGFAIGSVSIISEAIHSGMDLLAAVIAFLSVRKSAEPPDQEHTFGHGKFEDISGMVEALLIFGAAILIIYEALRKILGENGTELSVDLLAAGILVMGISGVVNWVVSARLMAVAKKTESIALESDAWHLRTDVYTSVGVFLGLILIRITGLTILDPLIGIAVALVIMKAAWDLMFRSYKDLIDHSLPDQEEQRIREIICEHAGQYADFHALRTRRSGPERFIDLHLTVPGNVPVTQAHDLADHLEYDLKTEFPRASITIHIEPCDERCDGCGSICLVKRRDEKKH